MNTYLQDFLDHLYDHDKSEQTIRAYLSDLSTFRHWLESQVDESFSPQIITPLDIVNYRKWLKENGKKSTTINRHLASLSSFCKWSYQSGLVPSDPSENIKSIAKETLGPKSLERKEQLALVRAVQRSGRKRDLAIINLLLHTGIRVSELCHLKTDDIITDGRKGIIKVTHGKGNKARHVPLNSTALKSLGMHIASEEDKSSSKKRSTHVFYGQKGQPLTVRGVRHLIKKYSYEAKIVGISPHTLRHTCAKNLIDAGQPIDRVAKILGHSSINTTSIYTMPTESDLQKTLQSISWE